MLQRQPRPKAPSFRITPEQAPGLRRRLATLAALAPDEQNVSDLRALAKDVGLANPEGWPKRELVMRINAQFQPALNLQWNRSSGVRYRDGFSMADHTFGPWPAEMGQQLMAGQAVPTHLVVSDDLSAAYKLFLATVEAAAQIVFQGDRPQEEVVLTLAVPGRSVSPPKPTGAAEFVSPAVLMTGVALKRNPGDTKCLHVSDTLVLTVPGEGAPAQDLETLTRDRFLPRLTAVFSRPSQVGSSCAQSMVRANVLLNMQQHLLGNFDFVAAAAGTVTAWTRAGSGWQVRASQLLPALRGQLLAIAPATLAATLLGPVMDEQATVPPSPNLATATASQPTPAPEPTSLAGVGQPPLPTRADQYRNSLSDPERARFDDLPQARQQALVGRWQAIPALASSVAGTPDPPPALPPQAAVAPPFSPLTVLPTPTPRAGPVLAQMPVPTPLAAPARTAPPQATTSALSSQAPHSPVAITITPSNVQPFYQVFRGAEPNEYRVFWYRLKAWSPPLQPALDPSALKKQLLVLQVQGAGQKYTLPCFYRITGASRRPSRQLRELTLEVVPALRDRLFRKPGTEEARQACHPGSQILLTPGIQTGDLYNAVSDDFLHKVRVFRVFQFGTWTVVIPNEAPGPLPDAPNELQAIPDGPLEMLLQRFGNLSMEGLMTRIHDVPAHDVPDLQ